MHKMISPQAIVQDLAERGMNDINAIRDGWRKLVAIIQWVWKKLTAFTRTRFFHRYSWAIVPVLLLLIFQAEMHNNYGALWLGDNMPDQANNVDSILRTGQMPPPPAVGDSCGSNATCQAYQPPLYYQIMAIPASVVMSVLRMSSADAIAWSFKLTMFLFSVLWIVVIVQAIQFILPRYAWIVKALVACIAVLIARGVLIANMVTNSLPESIASMAAILVLYLILRTQRKLKWFWWIAAAALIGLSAAFRYTGVQLLVIYGLVAACIAIGYLIRRKIRPLRTVILSALVGAPFMIIPYLGTVQHIQQYFPANVIARDIAGEASWDGNMATFLSTVSTDMLNEPMWGLIENQPPSLQMPGLSSFWSLQYTQLFVDFGNRWVKPIEFSLPPEQLKVNQYDGSTKFFGTPIAIARFNSIILLTRLAVPIALLMVIGLLGLIGRLILHPRRVIRDGTLVILLIALLTIGSFAVLSAQYHNRAAFTDPQVAIYVYVLLLIAGAAWLQRLWAKRMVIQIPIVMVQTGLWVTTVAFIGASFAFFWINSAG